ncbi:MAG: hypothetical protein FWD47_13290 [Treponema sp.]|nr:hypothetical protein [Treponema sp.]
MFKRIFIILLLLCLSTAVFAQERANSAYLDLFPLLKGFIATDNSSDTYFICISAGYERLIFSHYSVGLNLDLFPGKINDIKFLYLGANAFARFYPVSENGENFFLGVSLGFNRQAIDGKADADQGGFFGITTGLSAGYKLYITGGFFAEMSMSYILSKLGESVVPLGWQGGLRVGFSF